MAKRPRARPRPMRSRAPPVDTGGGERVARAEIGRAETATGAAGAAAPGGGTAAPARSARGPALAANVVAEVATLSGAPQSSGAREAIPIESSSLRASRQSGGVAGPNVADLTGAAQGETIADARGARVGSAPGRRRTANTAAESPAAGGGSTSGAPRRTTVAGVTGGALAAAAIELPQAGPAESGEVVLAAAGDVTMSRQASGGLEVDIDAVDGPGGLGARAATNAGYVTRRAQPDSLEVAPTFTRFDRREAGGKPRMTTSAVVAADPFRGRTPPGEGPGGNPGNGSPQTEEAIERGMVFLARHQADDGRWSLNEFGRGGAYRNETAALNSDTAATGLALLAFQGAGYNHREFRYRETVRGGVQWLVDKQKENGDLYVVYDDKSNNSVWLYSHSIATLALCEAYGMTQDPELREPAQRAINFIVESQQKDRGGWRYSPNYGADTSVTGWMMMALKSGELANLDVPSDTYDRIRNWLDLAQVSRSERHLYRYNPYAPDTETQRHGRSASKTMTSVGLLMRLYSGWRRDNANMVNGADYLLDRLPSMGTTSGPERDTYYWYYATQVMFHMGGDYWRQWNDRLHPLLVQTQQSSGPLAGSWNPRSYPAGNRNVPIADRWGPHAGRIYVTTMNLLSLEVVYRHLPLYEDTAR